MPCSNLGCPSGIRRLSSVSDDDGGGVEGSHGSAIAGDTGETWNLLYGRHSDKV
jgi:hypothetical protein